jgi:septal ring factor EnvC (AmiA/AmiB activator)
VVDTEGHELSVKLSAVACGCMDTNNQRTDHHGLSFSYGDYQMNYIPWIISFCSLIVAILSLAHTSNKDRTNEIREDTEKFDGIEKSLLKANIKLDQVCSTTTETRSDIKSLNADLKTMDTRVVVLERDMKTAFNAIAELKRKINHED